MTTPPTAPAAPPPTPPTVPPPTTWRDRLGMGVVVLVVLAVLLGFGVGGAYSAVQEWRLVAHLATAPRIPGTVLVTELPIAHESCGARFTSTDGTVRADAVVVEGGCTLGRHQARMVRGLALPQIEDGQDTAYVGSAAPSLVGRVLLCLLLTAFGALLLGLPLVAAATWTVRRLRGQPTTRRLRKP